MGATHLLGQIDHDRPWQTAQTEQRQQGKIRKDVARGVGVVGVRTPRAPASTTQAAPPCNISGSSNMQLSSGVRSPRRSSWHSSSQLSSGKSSPQSSWHSSLQLSRSMSPAQHSSSQSSLQLSCGRSPPLQSSSHSSSLFATPPLSGGRQGSTREQRGALSAEELLPEAVAVHNRSILKKQIHNKKTTKHIQFTKMSRL